MAHRVMNDSVPSKGRIVTASAAVALLVAVWVPASRAFFQIPEPGAVPLERIGQLHFDHQVADLWVHAGFAYLGSHACGKGEERPAGERENDDGSRQHLGVSPHLRYVGSCRTAAACHCANAEESRVFLG